VHVLRDTIHGYTKTNVKERRAALHAPVERECECPDVSAIEDVADLLNRTANQDTDELPDHRVLNAGQLCVIQHGARMFLLAPALLKLSNRTCKDR
jgi:hypothetical protein